MERNQDLGSNMIDIEVLFNQNLIDNSTDDYGLCNLDMSEYTSSVTCSTDPLTSLLDSSKNNDSLSLNDIVEEKKEEEKPKRGRKPLRPTDPIRTKTEEKDKF